MIPVGTTIQWRLANRASNGPREVSQRERQLWQQKTLHGLTALPPTVQPRSLSFTNHGAQANFELIQVQIQGWHPELPAL